MRRIFVIQDIETKEYYYEDGNIEGFDINKAAIFNSKRQAVKKCRDNIYRRLIEIKECYET